MITAYCQIIDNSDDTIESRVPQGLFRRYLLRRYLLYNIGLFLNLDNKMYGELFVKIHNTLAI